MMACELICCAGRVFSEQIKGVINEGKPPEEQRHGGYMCVFEGRSVPVPPILLVKIGEQEPSLSLKDAIFCQENCLSCSYPCRIIFPLNDPSYKTFPTASFISLLLKGSK